MDERILLIPPPWAPNLDTNVRLGSVKRLVKELQAALPIDFFRWPSSSTKGADGWRGTAELMAVSMRANHHVVDFGASYHELALWAVAQARPASLTSAGFWPSPATLLARRLPDLANTSRGMSKMILASSLPIMRAIMEGADDNLIAELSHQNDEETDRRWMTPVTAEWDETNYLNEGIHIACPAQFLMLPSLPGADQFADIYRTYAPHALIGQLEKWTVRMHEEEGGYELAEQALAFIDQNSRSGRRLPVSD